MSFIVFGAIGRVWGHKQVGSRWGGRGGTGCAAAGRWRQPEAVVGTGKGAAKQENGEGRRGSENWAQGAGAVWPAAAHALKGGRLLGEKLQEDRGGRLAGTMGVGGQPAWVD